MEGFHVQKEANGAAYMVLREAKKEEEGEEDPSWETAPVEVSN